MEWWGKKIHFSKEEGLTDSESKPGFLGHADSLNEGKDNIPLTIPRGQGPCQN